MGDLFSDAEQRATVIAGFFGLLGVFVTSLFAYLGVRYQHRAQANVTAGTQPNRLENIVLKAPLRKEIILPISVIVGLVAFIGAGFWYATRPDESVMIHGPASNEPITVNIGNHPSVGEFLVWGSSEDVESNQDLRIYVLSRRTEPSFNRYFVTGPAGPAEGDGNWRTLVKDGWAESPSTAGIELDIIAVAANPTNVPTPSANRLVDHPNDLNPAARSQVVHIVIEDCNPVCATPIA